MRPKLQGAIRALTCSRLCLTVWLWKAVQHDWVETVIGLVAMIVADVLDGVIARQLGLDGVKRRLLDTAIDRFSVHSVYAAALWAHPHYLGLYWPLLGRDLLLIAGYFVFLRPQQQIVKGSIWHTLSSLSLAGLCVLIVADAKTITRLVGIVTIVIGYVLLADYAGLVLVDRRRCLPPTKSPDGVIRVRGLRGIQALFGRNARTL